MNNQHKIVAAAGLSAIAVLTIVWLLRRRKSKTVEDDQAEIDFADLTAADTSSASANASVAEVAVPYYAVGSIIGRGGEVIKQLKKETGTRLDFNDRRSNDELDKSDRILMIRGSREKVELAEMRIKQLLANLPVVTTEDVYIPQNCCGRIIGKGGQTIREMCKVSGARITVDRQEGVSLNGKRKVTITGSDNAIELAKALINEKLQAEQQFRSKRTGQQGNRDSGNFVNIKDFPAMTFPERDEFVKAFVSAFDTPSHIWVQVINQESTHLDSLTADMTTLYADTVPDDATSNVSVGMICCAPFELDQEWYRACVTETFEDGTVSLYYMDFGDTGTVPKSSLRRLRAEFMDLPAQAIQCCLDDVKPAGDAWSSEAVQCFETLSHCAQWVPLMVHVVGHKMEEGQSIPMVEIIDTTGEKDVNIKEVLIKAGHGVPFSADDKAADKQCDEKAMVSEESLNEQQQAVQANEQQSTRSEENQTLLDNQPAVIIQAEHLQSEPHAEEDTIIAGNADVDASVPMSDNNLSSTLQPPLNGSLKAFDGETDIDDDRSEADSFFSARSDARTPTNMDDFDGETMSYSSARSDIRTPTNLDDLDVTAQFQGNNADVTTEDVTPRRKSSNDYDIIATPVTSDADEDDVVDTVSEPDQKHLPQQNDTDTLQSNGTSKHDTGLQYEIRVIDEAKQDQAVQPGLVGKETAV